MADRVSLVIHPSATGAPELDVRDAMMQVHDFFDLLSVTNQFEKEQTVIWLLEKATTNSPFTVEAACYSKDPTDMLDGVGADIVRSAIAGIVALIENRPPLDWPDLQPVRVVKRLFERNLNSIGKSDLYLVNTDVSVSVLPREAERGIKYIEELLGESLTGKQNLSRTEFGTAEAIILTAQTYYGAPALLLKDWLSGERVICVLSKDVASEMGGEHSLSAVWEGKRLRITGQLNYDRQGKLTKIDADFIEEVFFSDVGLTEIRALDVTGGRDPQSYLDLIRREDNA